jgi:hypothetical protein
MARNTTWLLFVSQVYSNGRQRLEDLCGLPYHTYKDVGVNVSDR